ncbi:dihydrodipicolinate synthase family protein [Rubrivirga sp.]|uniref:dihydrodipicolinate synthase family protein n=1 Tax=Rubrivirga sp. TaxID=1885344 RepID=UPI003B515527
MPQSFPMPPPWVSDALRDGLAIPAHPLALTSGGALDERHQRALTRYYHTAGAGGLAVGVHTTQFAIRDVGLLEPVLALAAETVAACDQATGRRTVQIAGVCGPTAQAVEEARLASDLGYHAGLLSLAALGDADLDALLAHCLEVAAAIPLVGFYLQPAVGGRALPVEFWRRFAQIPNVVAVKVAPFDRYRTLDVVRAVAESGRALEVALYTGNDDHILLDLLTRYEVALDDGTQALRFAGGLLGHWACWTTRAVEHLEVAKSHRQHDEIPTSMLTLAAQITESNAALFDPSHGFAGCIAGIHHVLHRQGLMASPRTLDPDETLSPGQRSAIDRVYRDVPHLTDDAFVAERLDDWLR